MASYAAKSVQFGVNGTGMAREKSLSEIRQPTVPDALLKFPFDIRTGCLQGPMQNDSRIGIGLIFRYKGLQARLAAVRHRGASFGMMSSVITIRFLDECQERKRSRKANLR